MKKVVLLLSFIVLFSGCAKRAQNEVPQCPDCPPCVQITCEPEKICDDYCEEKAEKEQLEREHPIDKKERLCLKDVYSTADMRRCAYDTMDAWFVEIDKNMAKLKELLPPEKYELLVKSQVKWEEYEKAEFEANTKLIFEKGGTIYYTISAGQAIGVIKERALLLKSYIYYYSDHFAEDLEEDKK